jgi:hypothetical protein
MRSGTIESGLSGSQAQQGGRGLEQGKSSVTQSMACAILEAKLV